MKLHILNRRLVDLPVLTPWWSQPIAAGDLVVGVLGMTILLDHLQNLVQDMKISGYGHGWIIDANGNTIAHPNAQFIGNQNIFTGNPELRILADEMLAGHAGLGFYHLNGTSKGLAYAPIPVTNWSIAMTANTATYLLLRQAAQLKYHNYSGGHRRGCSHCVFVCIAYRKPNHQNSRLGSKSCGWGLNS